MRWRREPEGSATTHLAPTSAVTIDRGRRGGIASILLRYGFEIASQSTCGAAGGRDSVPRSLVTVHLRRAMFAGLAANELRRRRTSGRSVLFSATRVCLSALQKEERIGRLQPARVCLSAIRNEYRIDRLPPARSRGGSITPAQRPRLQSRAASACHRPDCRVTAGCHPAERPLRRSSASQRRSGMPGR